VTHDYMFIGPSPSNESCAQVGDPDYARNAKAECRLFIDAIRNHCGREPEGARLLTRGQGCDMGLYYEVCVQYDGSDAAARDYAFHVEANAPTTWEEGRVEPPRSVGRGR
jgi:hypothetical protein